MDRPLGITILGGLVGLAALISFLISLASFIVGLAFLLPFPAEGVPLLLNGLLFFGIAIVLGAASLGLMQMRAWGWAWRSWRRSSPWSTSGTTPSSARMRRSP